MRNDEGRKCDIADDAESSVSYIWDLENMEKDLERAKE